MLVPSSGITNISQIFEFSLTLLSECKEALPPYMLPRSITFLEEFPLNANGKIERSKLSHLYAKQPDPSKVKARIATFEKSLKNLRDNVKNKEDNKSVSLSTSKINYMDPRVTVAWCKRNEVPIERIFAKTLRDKFPWAMAVPPDWKFI